MAAEIQKRPCPNCDVVFYYESFFCNLYVRTKDFMKPVHGESMVATQEVKSQAPRNWFKEHGEEPIS
eukprot:4004588-Lingulodinium_polyedra.AAC.1